jgi:hypothetical protein
MKTETLESVATKLVAPGKGILAADESSGTIEKRLKSINVPSTEENRRMYREILFTTDGAGEFISGVILHFPTLRLAFIPFLLLSFLLVLKSFALLLISGPCQGGGIQSQHQIAREVGRKCNPALPLRREELTSNRAS